jgi:hypothetical protein
MRDVHGRDIKYRSPVCFMQQDGTRSIALMRASRRCGVSRQAPAPIEESATRIRKAPAARAIFFGTIFFTRARDHGATEIRRRIKCS